MVIVLDTTADGQGLLGAQKDLVIDTLPPGVLGVSSSKPNGKGDDVLPTELSRTCIRDKISTFVCAFLSENMTSAKQTRFYETFASPPSC